MKHLYFYVAIFLNIAILSCNATIYIASDNTDMIFAANAYNNTFKKKKPIIVFVSQDISHTVSTQKTTYVVSKTTTTQQQKLLSSFSFNPINLTDNNVSITKSYNNMQLLSFSLPLIIIKKDSKSNQHFFQSRITSSELQNLSKSLIKKINDYNYILGFYPTDNTFIDIFDNEIQYQEWLNFAQIDNPLIQQYYNAHFSIVPLKELLTTDNIIYKYISSYDYFLLPQDIRNQFDVFIFTKDNGQIPIVSPVYIGSLAKSKDKRHHFIKWLLSVSAQQKIIDLKQQYTNNTLSFIDNHLSTIWNVNLSTIFASDFWLWNNQPLFSQIFFPQVQ